jgi:2-polyprenyl-6-hydroxyphenyl methylase/3-demethylubiquinone-9 3-methyltransferase
MTVTGLTDDRIARPRTPMGILRSFINSQIWLSKHFDRLLPDEFHIDGNSTFSREFTPPFLAPGLKVYDLGGGMSPHISPQTKRALQLVVMGVDISAEELRNAPVGAYDEMVCCDVATLHGAADADLVICRAVLEHVQDVEGAFRAVASMLKPGGRALIFVPSRNAVFARLNLLLPQGIKRWLLYKIFPQTRSGQGFPSYYRLCTPRDFRRLAETHALRVERLDTYYVSSYFSFFFPLYLLWRLWLLIFRACAGEQAAESFAVVLRSEQTLVR